MTRFLMGNTSSARGNTSLESAVSLTKSLRWEIQNLGQRLATAANAEESMQKKSPKAYDKAQHERELKYIIQAIHKLLTRIEDAVPLINLAITASGATLSSTLPSTVSPSRLLQASTFLTAGDSQYGVSALDFVQIGPTFTLSMYMLFLGHAPPEKEEDVRKSTWKEVIHKADVRLMRVPITALYTLPATRQQAESPHPKGNTPTSSDSNVEEDDHFARQMEGEVRTDEYAYQLLIVEDFEDDRVHDFKDGEVQPGPYLEVPMAGIREVVPIHELSKIFYADTGKILNIGNEGETNSPVLLLKRDPNANPPRRMMGQYDDDDGQDYDDHETNGIAQSVEEGDAVNAQILVASKKLDQWRLPLNLDPEWIAFEVYTEAEDSEDEDEAATTSSGPTRASRAPSLDPQMMSALSRLNVNKTLSSSPSPQPPTPQIQQGNRLSLPPIRTSLSLLETLLRLLSLQQFQQAPHLSVSDEILTFFLNESASTGAASNDVQERKRLREEARRHVGFDPYDESPVKRRGEEYQYYGREGTQSRHDKPYLGEEGREVFESATGLESPSYEDEGHDTKNWTYPGQYRRSPSVQRQTAPQTPPLLLKHRSRSRTPDRSPVVSTSRYAPPRRWTDGRGGLRQAPVDAGRRGSPLARPGTGTTDEGLGTSPASLKEEQK